MALADNNYGFGDWLDTVNPSTRKQLVDYMKTHSPKDRTPMSGGALIATGIAAGVGIAAFSFGVTAGVVAISGEDRGLGAQDGTKFVLHSTNFDNTFTANVKGNNGELIDATFVDTRTGQRLGDEISSSDIYDVPIAIEHKGAYSPLTFKLTPDGDGNFFVKTGKLSDTDFYRQIQPAGELSSPTNIPALGAPAKGELGL